MNAGRYRKRPVVIDAVEWDGTEAGLRPVFDLIGDFAKLPNNDGYVRPGVGYTPAVGTLDIPTLEGTMTAQPGDWIVRGVKGECYPVKPDIFAATYEPEATGSAERDKPCDHSESLYGRCVACGMTWEQQAATRAAGPDDEKAETFRRGWMAGAATVCEGNGHEVWEDATCACDFFGARGLTWFPGETIREHHLAEPFASVGPPAELAESRVGTIKENLTPAAVDAAAEPDPDEICAVCLKPWSRCKFQFSHRFEARSDVATDGGDDPLVLLLWLYVNRRQAEELAPKVRALLSRDSAPADGTEFFTGPGSAETPQERRERWERNLLYRLAAAVRAYTLEVDDGVIYSMDEADWFDVLSKATVSQGYSKYDDLVWENKKRHSKPPVSE